MARRMKVRERKKMEGRIRRRRDGRKKGGIRVRVWGFWEGEEEEGFDLRGLR